MWYTAAYVDARLGRWGGGGLPALSRLGGWWLLAWASVELTQLAALGHCTIHTHRDTHTHTLPLALPLFILVHVNRTKFLQ